MHFTLNQFSKDKRSGRQARIYVSAENLETAGYLAEHFDLPVDVFLHQLVFGTLPGQPSTVTGRRIAPLEERLRARHIAFECHDKVMAARLKRAAQAMGKPLKVWIAEQLGSCADACEENMIVHPKTGALLWNDASGLFERTDLVLTTAKSRGEVKA